MLLNVQGISVFYRDREVLHDVSLCVESGEIVCLLGANASGKTTTLRSIIGITRINKGKIQLRGEDITGIAPDAIVRRGVAIVPENRRLFPKMTVEENLLLIGHRYSERKSLFDSLEFIKGIFPILAEPMRWKQMAGTLSGGEQQQVAMARALLLQPCLLLMDEPSMGMSIKLVTENFRIVRQLAEKGIGILMVEQNVKMALSVASRGYVLQEGRIITRGTSTELLTNKVIQHSYLGEFV